MKYFITLAILPFYLHPASQTVLYMIKVMEN